MFAHKHLTCSQKKVFVGSLLFLGLLFTNTYADPHHTVFDFTANRLLAHVEKDGLWLDARSPGFAKYTHGMAGSGWVLNASIKESSHHVALAPTEAKLFIPWWSLPNEQMTLTMRLYVPQPSSVSGTIGTFALTEQKLQPGENTLSWVIPKEHVPTTEEKPLQLIFATSFSPAYKAAAVVWIHIGAKNDLTPPNPRLQQDQALLIPGDGALSYAMQLPATGSFVFSGTSNGCTLELALNDNPTSKSVKRFSVSLDGRPVSIPSDFAQKSVWVGLHANGSCKQLALTKAEIQLPGPAPILPTIRPPKRIVLWLSDDTRVDRLRAWNPNSRVETPFLDNVFGKKATRFAVTYAQGNESRASHASLFTGLYPAQHGMITEKAKLNPTLLLISEAAKQSGLKTACHTSNGYVSQRWGFGDGWDEFHNYIHEQGELSGEFLVNQFNAYLKRNQTQPFFFFLGSIDAHVSWRAREPWISRYDKAPYQGPFTKGLMDPQLDQIVAEKLSITDRDKERTLALYDSNLSYTDAQLQRLWESLQKQGLLEDTMLIFTSDHGEEFWEYGKIGHGQSLHPELVHVPLYIYYPPLFPEGKVVTESVELIDILPTLFEVMGKKIPESLQGQSLIPLANGKGQGFPRPAVSSQYEHAYTMRLDRFKLTVDNHGKWMLHDVGTIRDKRQEDQPLLVNQPIQARMVADPLALWIAYQAQWRKTRVGVPNNHEPAFANQLEQQR